MNRLKSSVAVAVTAFALTASAYANIGGTDPKPPYKPPTADYAGVIQVAITMLGL